MTDSGRDRLAVLLAGAHGSEAFSAARTAPARELHIEVRGVGPIELPVSQAQARQLCLLGRPARYGRGERTVLDRRVRDTWEIPKSRVKIDKRGWDRVLVPVLDRLGHDLGVPSGCKLRAELHSMLVYAPGQFFAEHQDSEKDDAMVGSLVVGLPSNFKGGALEVSHGGKLATYRGSKSALSFVAFYGDCRHQVKPVTSGYRVVLTYNLLLRGKAASSTVDLDPELVGSLARCLDEHFASPVGADRLVYLLDHEYTRRGLDWSRLKGADARRVTVLKAAAERAGCDVVLALADVHEMWSAYESDERDRWYGRSRYSRWDEDDDELDSFDGDGAGDYYVEELIESEVTLDSWIDSEGARLENVALSVGDHEVCASTPSGDLEPYSSEYEGYMGNWGNTLDRWYHRGAVVAWPRSRAFVVRAEASPSWALDELTARARKGDLIGAREASAALAPFWERVAARVETSGFFTKALRTARLVDEPALAAMLLQPFRLETLAPSHAKPLSALVDCYGEHWAGELVTAWSPQRRGYHPKGPSPETWMASLPALCRALRATGDAGTSAARILLQESWSAVSQSIDCSLELTSPSQREQALAALGPPIAGVLQATSVGGACDARDEAVAALSHPDLVVCGIAALRAIPAPQWSAAGLDVVAAHCSAVLEASLARPPRASDDWSLDLPSGCSCELCNHLREFLQDAMQTRLEWPLAKDRRAHVHRRIDTAELPVAHQTRRVGRPYTLILTKTTALFERATQQRRRDAEHLAWLERKCGGRANRRADAG
jgi:hypothetical protein